MKKVLIVVGIPILLAVGWICGFRTLNNATPVADMQIYIDLALEQETMGAYGAAVQSRERLVEMDPSVDNYYYLAEAYKSAGRTTMYKKALEAMMSKFPNDPRAYERLAEYYSDNNAAEDCVAVIRKAAGKGLRSASMDNLFYSNAYKFNTLVFGFDEAYRFYGTSALVKMNDKYSFVNKDMDTICGGYKEAHSNLEGIIGIQDKMGERYFISSDGAKYLDSQIAYDGLSSFSESLALTVLDGKWRYLTKRNQHVFGEYDAATLFVGGVAAVKKGDTWSIINTKGESINGEKYVDVIIDEDNVCSRGGRIFVKKKKDKGYYMIDLAGNRVGKGEYVDAKLFYNSQYTAVKEEVEDKETKKKIEKWGFIGVDGSTLIAPAYEDAQPFGTTIAAVKVDGLWGFITEQERMVIEPQFEDAKSFNSNKIAPVKKNGVWGYIELIVKK